MPASRDPEFTEGYDLEPAIGDAGEQCRCVFLWVTELGFRPEAVRPALGLGAVSRHPRRGS